MDDQILPQPPMDLAHIFRDAPMGFCIFDLEFCYVFVNEALAAINNVPVDAHYHQTIYQVVPEVAVRVDKQLRHVVETGESFVSGHFVSDRSAFHGEARVFQHTFSAIRDDAGNISGVSCFVQDITDKHHAETELAQARERMERRTKKYTEALRKSEKQIRTITDSLPVLITYMNLDCCFEYANKTAEAWYGKPLDKIVGMRVSDLMGEPAFDRLEPHIDRAISGERSLFEDTVTYPDGKTRNVQISYLPDFSENGSVRGYFGLVVDLTANKQVETALTAANMYLSSAIESISEGFVLWDQDDRFVICNDKYKDFYPQIKDDLVPGTRLADLARKAVERGAVKGSIENVEQWVEQRLAQQESGQGLLEQELVDGRWLLCNVRKLAGGFTASIRTDITELKQAADDLRQAQKMEAIGQLTGGVAHDFNNLLAVIMGNLELLEMRIDADSKASDFVARAVTATQRGSDLTDRLLAFSRKEPLQPVSVDISELVKDMQELLVRTLGNAIEIELSVAVPLWQCEVDPGQLENAILNLCINARDAMPFGGQLTIAASNTHIDDALAKSMGEARSGEYVLLTISDTGTGMSTDVMQQAFEPFFTTKDVGKGSGLGLSMIYGFVRQSKGHVRIHSELGKGTAMSMCLPRSSTFSVGKAAADGTPALSTAARGESILVVEDDAEVRAVTVNFLDELGYEIYEAATAEVALEIFQRNPKINMLLADIILPGGMDGRQLADRACELFPDLKILYMSGYTKDAMIHFDRLDDGVQWLVKPFAKADLAMKVRQILDDLI